MKKFSESLREHAVKIINFKKKKMKLLANEQQESNENSKTCYICIKNNNKDEKYCKVRDRCHYTGEYRGATHSICNLKYSIPKEITIIFHRGSNYDFHFIIKQLADKFEGQFSGSGENTEKYKTFSVPIEKKVNRNGKNGEKMTKTISYRLKFIYSARFIVSSLSNLVKNLAEGIHKLK